MIAAAIYARYSSDLQREASIEDQNRICRERAAKEGWSVHQCYSDRGTSGASLIRPGIQKLLQDAQARRFEIVLAESLDGCPAIRKKTPMSSSASASPGRGWLPCRKARSTNSISVSRDDGSAYLKDLADKTRRGLRGRAEAGIRRRNSYG